SPPGFTGVPAATPCCADAGSFPSANDTPATAPAPAGACDGRWRITTPAGTAASDGAYTVNPRITSFTPTTGAVASTVTISGVGFTGVTAVSLCFVDAGSFHFLTDPTVPASVPAGACDGRWRITTPAGTAASDSAYTITG